MDQTTTQPDLQTDREPLCDEEGPIPTFPPLKVDGRGRTIPLSPEEKRARSEAVRRMLKVLRDQPDNDPAGIEEEIMRGIDTNRPDGMKLFEGYY